MYKVLSADKDTYITNRVIGNAVSGSRVNSNMGRAGTLDLFKLYGVTFGSGSIPNRELSRCLIHFDLQKIRDLITTGKININDSSFNCKMKLFDIYGGQTTPADFYLSVFPLSRSFAEGDGRDVVYYTDYDTSNFLSSSYADGAWFITGCALGGYSTQQCDYITGSSALGDLEIKQYFKTGEENLEVDVTKIVSATLAGDLPDAGFRVSFSAAHEEDQQSYFVKRFSSRSAYDTSKRPSLIMRYDDSLQDDTQILRFDSAATLFFRNFSYGSYSNILSGSSLLEVSGTNCIILKLTATRSDGSGSYTLAFTGSQYTDGANFYPGLYDVSVLIPSSDAVLSKELKVSSSIEFTPIWCSVDDTVGYYTGSVITARPPQRSPSAINFSNYVFSTIGLNETHPSEEQVFVRLNIFNYASPYIKLVKTPAILPGIVIKETYYQVRDYATNETVIPFDEVYNSTRVSSDSDGMFFTLDMSNLKSERTYVIDIMTKLGGVKKIYRDVSTPFTVSDNQI